MFDTQYFRKQERYFGRTEFALQRLRDLRKEEQFAEDKQAQAFLTEAERLLSGDKQ